MRAPGAAGPHALRLAGTTSVTQSRLCPLRPGGGEAGKGSGLGRGPDPGRTHVCTREHVHGACASAGPSGGWGAGSEGGPSPAAIRPLSPAVASAATLPRASLVGASL